MNPALSIALAALFAVAWRSIVVVNYVVFARLYLRIRLPVLRLSYNTADIVLTVISIASLSSALMGFHRVATAWIAFVSLVLSTTYLLFRLTGETGKKDY